LATAEARGAHRAQEVLEKLLASPLLDGGQALGEAEDVLVSLVGGPDLSMADIRRVMEAIQRQSEHAHLIFGAAIDPGFAECLAVTLVASRRGPEMTQTEARPAAPSRRVEPSPRSMGDAPELGTQLLNPEPSNRSASRFVAPPPELTPERAEQLLGQQGVSAARQRKQLARMRQGQLPLDIIAKGRFEKSVPTIHDGEDLDVPTYIRRGVALN
jgi:cell division protein FtsZ